MQDSNKVEERQRKITQIRRKRRLRLFLSFLFLAAVILLAITLYNSSFFKVKEIKVTGNDYFKAKEIIALAGIQKDVKLFTFPVNKVRRRLNGQSRIKDAKIIRKFPDRIVIKVLERQPIALVSLKDAYTLIDEDSVVLDYVDNPDTFNLPVIKELKINRLPRGKRVETQSLSNALKCLTNLDPSIKSVLSIVSAPSVDKLTLFTNEGVEILYGEAKDVNQKNYVLRKILSQNEKDVIFIDVRAVSNPVIKRLKPEPKPSD